MATTYISDGSLANTQALVTGATEGDTVYIGPGPGTWTWDGGSLTVTKNITVSGYGMFDDAFQTVITGTGSNGHYVTLTTTSGAPVMTLQKMTFLMPVATSGTPMPPGEKVIVGGVGRMKNIGGVITGGFRITEIRWTATNFICNIGNPSAGPTNCLRGHMVKFNDWVTGVIDHCWLDLKGLSGSTAFFMGLPSMPGQPAGPNLLSPVPAPSPNPYLPSLPHSGQFAYACDWAWGGGHDLHSPIPIIATDYSRDAVYIEDLLSTKANSLTDTTDQLNGGGGRFVVRYCSLQDGSVVHGFGESGGNCGSNIAEFYNNLIYPPTDTPTVSKHNCRAGAMIYFNERYVNCGSDTNIASNQMSRLASNAKEGMVGPADGTNFFDQNAHDPVLYLDANHEYLPPPGTGAVYTFPMVPDPLPNGMVQSTDARVGNIYFAGTNAVSLNNQTVQLNGVDGGPNPDKFVGFTLRREAAPPQDDGGQTVTTDGKLVCALISSNTAGPNTILTVLQGHDVSFAIAATEWWTMRYVINAIGVAGGTKIPQLNGQNLTQANMHPAYLVAKNGVFQYWGPQQPDGCWSWHNKIWTAGNWQNCEYPAVGGATSRFVQGGKHNNIRSIANKGTATVTEDYPEIQNPTANQLRIGADPSFWPVAARNTYDTNGVIVSTLPATQAWGANYPHPAVSGVTIPAGKLISLSGSLAFGDVIIGSISPTANLRVTNSGDATLTVTSVSYPNGFSGPTTGFAVAAQSFFDVTVTFTPLSAVNYSGNIVVASDATNTPNATIAASGRGIAPTQQLQGHRKQTRDSWGF